MKLRTWIIEPRDSVIFRDGKPFGANVTSATSLDFPFSSTIAGVIRSRVGSDREGIFRRPADKQELLTKLDGLRQIQMFGPILAELDDNGEIDELYLSSPSDALLLQNKDQKKDETAQILRLRPLSLEKLAKESVRNGIMALPNGLTYPVGLNRTDKKDKAYGDLPYWKWEKVKDWLIDSEIADDALINLDDYGIGSLVKDARTHVAIDGSFSATEGALFTTRGLEFRYPTNCITARRFGLAVFLPEADANGLNDRSRISPLGGERRLVEWRPSNRRHPITRCPEQIAKQIESEGHCRLLLLTPGYFSKGMPENPDGCEIHAIANNRYQTVSGWDFDKRGPKPTRRLVPAGSVMFVKLLMEKRKIGDWIQRTWFSCLGDDDQSKRDGYGLCVLGTWDGKAAEDWKRHDSKDNNQAKG